MVDFIAVLRLKREKCDYSRKPWFSRGRTMVFWVTVALLTWFSDFFIKRIYEQKKVVIFHFY